MTDYQVFNLLEMGRVTALENFERRSNVGVDRARADRIVRRVGELDRYSRVKLQELVRQTYRVVDLRGVDRRLLTSMILEAEFGRVTMEAWMRQEAEGEANVSADGNGTGLQERREARFAELEAMNKSQLYRILKLQEESGRMLAKGSVLTKMTRAGLIWLLVDAEMPLTRKEHFALTDEEEDGMRAVDQRGFLMKEAEEAAAKEAAKAKAKPKRSRKPKAEPIVASSGPTGHVATAGELGVALSKVRRKGSDIAPGRVGGRKGCLIWQWAYIASHYVDPVAWADAKRLELEVTVGRRFSYRTLGRYVIFEPVPK